MKIIPAPKNLQIITIRYQSLRHLINLQRFLTLSFTIAEYNIAVFVRLVIFEIPFHPYNARFLSMLQIIPMPFRNVGLGCSFDPSDGIHNLVSPNFVHHIDSPLEFRIDDPNH